MADLQNVATTLITKFGAACSLTTATGVVNGRAVFLTREADDNAQGHVIEKTNTVYFTSTKNEPLPGDVLVFGKRSYIVTAVEQFNPNALKVIVWKMEVST